MEDDSWMVTDFDITRCRSLGTNIGGRWQTSELNRYLILSNVYNIFRAEGSVYGRSAGTIMQGSFGVPSLSSINRMLTDTMIKIVTNQEFLLEKE